MLCTKVENVLFLIKMGPVPFFLVFSQEKKYNPFSIRWFGFSPFRINSSSGKEVIGSRYGEKILMRSKA